MTKKISNKLDCNRNGCPGMAHDCSRINYTSAKWALARGEHGIEVAEALRLECERYEGKILTLKDELLEAYRRINS